MRRRRHGTAPGASRRPFARPGVLPRVLASPARPGVLTRVPASFRASRRPHARPGVLPRVPAPSRASRRPPRHGALARAALSAAQEIPWDILALDCGQDLDAEQRWHPRVFKSHEPAHSVAQGGRYIVVLREPADALVSFWRFLPAYAGLQPGDVSLEAFAGALFSGVSVSGQIWHHLLGWWQLRAQPHVLVVTYEDLKRDLCGEVAAVAHFLGMQPGPARDELVARVAAQCTLDAMTCAQHARKFDDHFVRAHVLPRMRCAPAAAVGGGSGTNAAVTHVSKARRDGGRVGYALPPTLRAQLDAKWAAIVEPQTGLRNYAHLCAELRREREARVAASGLEPAAPGADGGGARAGGAKVKAA